MVYQCCHDKNVKSPSIEFTNCYCWWHYLCLQNKHGYDREELEQKEEYDDFLWKLTRQSRNNTNSNDTNNNNNVDDIFISDDDDYEDVLFAPYGSRYKISCFPLNINQNIMNVITNDIIFSVLQTTVVLCWLWLTGGIHG